MTTTTRRTYGWHPDLPDPRDRLLSLPPPRFLELMPRQTDLRPRFPVPCYDQAALGSCTANAIGACVRFERLRDGVDPDFDPSRLFVYFNERSIEHTIAIDSGAQIRDGMKALKKWGVCSEASWPYTPDVFAQRPAPAAFAEAERHKAIAYRRVPPSLPAIKFALYSGSPLAFGFSVYESFEGAEVAATGMVPVPGHGEGILGGHAVAAFGYDDDTGHLIVRNSWGAAWGLEGYCLMPYDFVRNGLTSDWWQLEVIR